MKHRVVTEPFFCERKLTLDLFSIEYVITIIIFIAKQRRAAFCLFFFIPDFLRVYYIFFRDEILYTIGVHIRHIAYVSTAYIRTYVYHKKLHSCDLHNIAFNWCILCCCIFRGRRGRRFSPSSVQYTFVHNIITVSHTLYCTNKVRGAIPARSYSLLICVVTQQCLWCRPSPYTMGLFVSQLAMSVDSNYVERHKTRKMDFQEITMLYILPEWFYANRVTDSLKAFVLICAVYGFPIFANSVVQLCDVRPEIRSHSIDCTTLSLSLSRL